MCAEKTLILAEKIRKQDGCDLIIVLADLDPDDNVQSITQRKNFIGRDNADLIIIARNAMEAWFLADTKAMRGWLKDGGYYEETPELHLSPWQEIRRRGKAAGRGPGLKPVFARKFVRDQGFDLERAAEHGKCPSARYCVDKLMEIGTSVAV